MNTTLSVGVRAGLILAAIFIANHLIEFLAPAGNRTLNLVRGAGAVLLMLGLFGAVGSAAWARTRSMASAVLAGLSCAAVGMTAGLGFAFVFNLVFATHVAARLHDAFAASGMSDAHAFVVRNAVESISEMLVRLPVAAVVLSFGGAILNALTSTRPRGIVVLFAWLTPLLFVAGAAAIWHANSLERSARPPFVMAGVLAAGLALCSAHPVWSSLGRRS